MVREVAKVSGKTAFELFEKLRPALARAMLSSEVIDPERTTAIRFDDDSVLWIFEFDNEEKAKALVNWMYNTLTSLKELLDFDKIEKKTLRGKDVVIVYSTPPNVKESYPSAFWASGNKFFWLESGHEPSTFEETLWELLSSP